jgi:hypothetical protein
VPSTADRSRVEQRILEESMRLPPGGAVSGWAALRLHGGGFFDGSHAGRDELPVDLALPAEVDLRPALGIIRHRSLLPAGDICVRHGIRCTTPERALFDAIRWQKAPIRRQQWADLALSAGLTTFAEMHTYLTTTAVVRGRQIVTRVIEAASDRVLSPHETTLRVMWEQKGALPPVRCNWPVADECGRRLGRPDLLCDAEAVVIEYDGRDHTRDDVRVVDLAKEDAYRRCGLEYIRVVGQDLAHPDRILARMHQAVVRSRSSNIPRSYQLARNPRPVRQQL